MKSIKPFPECTTNCGVVKELGVGECEGRCPEKFKKKRSIMTYIYFTMIGFMLIWLGVIMYFSLIYGHWG